MFIITGQRINYDFLGRTSPDATNQTSQKLDKNENNLNDLQLKFDEQTQYMFHIQEDKFYYRPNKNLHQKTTLSFEH